MHYSENTIQIVARLLQIQYKEESQEKDGVFTTLRHVRVFERFGE